MKNILLLFVFALTLVSCETDQEQLEETNSLEILTSKELVAAVFAEKPNPDFDNVKEGLYRGVFSTYDLSIKGEILIDLGNTDKIQAAVKLIRGGKDFYFTGRKKSTRTEQYIFESDRGSFEVMLIEDGMIKISHFTFDDKDTYIVSYKETRGANISISYGTFTDDADPLFMGNWDAINKGATYMSPPAHSTIPTPLSIIEEVIITKDSEFTISQDTSPFNDSFLEPCFYADTFQHGYFFITVDSSYKEIIAYNQTTTFIGNVATWSMSYYLFGGTFFYDTPACSTSEAAGYGSWTWNGRSGRIRVDRLGTP